MTAGRSIVAAWRTFRSSFGAITSRVFRRCRHPRITSCGRCWRCLNVAKLELYGTASCPYTQELREWLEWTRRDFDEFDVEADPEARMRMYSIDSSLRTVPVLIED